MRAGQFSPVERLLQNAIDTGATPGVALLVEKNGELVYQKALGNAQIYPEPRPLGFDDLFDLASLTKVVATTTAIMQLTRDQRLDVREAVQRYLPEFPHPQITLWHLLTHSAGLTAWLPLYERIQTEAACRDAALQLALAHIYQTPLIYTPGQESTYSDLGFIVLGYLIETLTQTPLNVYCAANIFQPLGMADTFFQPIGKPHRAGAYVATERCVWRQKILCGEVHDENAFALGGVAGHAGLFGTLADIRRFMTTMRRCYVGEDDFVPPPIVRQFFTRQPLAGHSTRALGWDTPAKTLKSSGGTLLSDESVGHTGFTGTSIWLDLKCQLLILLFANRIHPSRQNHTFLNIRPKIHDAVVIATDA